MKNVTFPKLEEGREYLCIGPNCWGRDEDAQKAIKIAKSNAGGGPWKFILNDVPAGSKVDEMGYNITYPIPEGKTRESIAPVREILRYEPKGKK